jgi:hypothetical protein
MVNCKGGMMRTTVVLCLMISASACTSEEAAPSDTLSVQMCSGFAAGDAYVLGDVALDGSDLLVHVRTGGGCASHTFSMCWDGAVLDSYPGTVNLGLSHDAHGDSCDAVLSHDLRIDVTSVLENTGRPIRLNVTGATTRIDGTTSSVTLDD